jgi:flagellar basal body rod protein FlgG
MEIPPIVVPENSSWMPMAGTLQLARFINPAGLRSLGKNLYSPTEASGDEITGTAGENGLGTIAQGFLEMSNVSVVDEMVSMITAQRAYETNSKVIQTADDMLQHIKNRNGLAWDYSFFWQPHLLWGQLQCL